MRNLMSHRASELRLGLGGLNQPRVDKHESAWECECVQLISFQVLEGDQLNAFAFPGGFVFVYTGLIEATETEAELAGAMAHEIAHVAARHFTRQATHSQIANYATLPLIFLGNGIGCYAVRQGA